MKYVSGLLFACAMFLPAVHAHEDGIHESSVAVFDAAAGVLTIPCVRLVPAPNEPVQLYAVRMQRSPDNHFSLTEATRVPDMERCNGTYTVSSLTYSDHVYASGNVYDVLMQNVPGTGFKLLQATLLADCRYEAVATSGCAPFREGDLAGVERFTFTSTRHVADPVYPDFPPAGGEHHACWANWGVSTKEVPARHFVHNLEHGGVVFLYNCPDGCDAELSWLQAFAASNTAGSVLVSPHKDLPRNFAVLAWGARLQSDKLNEASFQQFYTDYKNRAPEFVLSDPPAACQGIF